jgi:hypothetical protein
VSSSKSEPDEIPSSSNNPDVVVDSGGSAADPVQTLIDAVQGCLVLQKIFRKQKYVDFDYHFLCVV